MGQDCKRPTWKQQPLSYFGAPDRHSRFSPLKESICSDWSSWYARYKSGTQNGGTFAIVGRRGTGKTQLAVSLMGHYYVNKSKSVKYIKFSDMVDGLIDDSVTRNELVRPDVLVIDGIEVRKNSEFEVREINAVIDKRYDHKGKITIMVSNDTKASLCEFVGASAVSRMKQEGGIVEFNGRSFRD